MRVAVRVRPLVLFWGSLWEKQGEAAKLMVRHLAGAPRSCLCGMERARQGAGWVRKEHENHVIVEPTHRSLIPLFSK